MNSQLLPEDYIFLKKKGIFYKIFVDDIAYFEASGDYLKVQLTDDRQYTSQFKCFRR
jgi:DNA-binding LytR/AlgR family response regulator